MKETELKDMRYDTLPGDVLGKIREITKLQTEFDNLAGNHDNLNQRRKEVATIAIDYLRCDVSSLKQHPHVVRRYLISGIEVEMELILKEMNVVKSKLTKIFEKLA